MALTDAESQVDEETTWVYTTTLIDENGIVLPLASIDTVTLTLCDKKTGTIINGRNGQNVKNANEVTIGATDGLLTWLALPADMIIVGTSVQLGARQHHIALWKIVYSTTKGLNREVDIFVKNLSKI